MRRPAFTGCQRLRPPISFGVMFSYRQIERAVRPTGMIARGGFEDADPDGHARTIVMIGNAGGAMWPQFTAERQPGPHPLDRWTRATLAPIAQRFGATYVHPSDEPFQPFQRWAQRADDVWQSPIGLLIHREFGLWHAYRGAFIFAETVHDLPPVGVAVNPCVGCIDQPCLRGCPVDAFGPDGYNTGECRRFVTEDGACLADGCAARRACPIGFEWRYGPEQMAFHMRAFLGVDT